MAKTITDGILDGTLDKFGACTTYTVCAGAPVTYADIANNSLGSITIAAGDFTKANGDTSGRKSTLAAKTITASAAGTADHVVVDDGIDFVVTQLQQAKTVDVGTQMDITAWALTISDPA